MNGIHLVIGAALVMTFMRSKAEPAFWGNGAVSRGLEYKPFFDAAESKYNIPDNLVAKVGWRESRFIPDVINGKVTGASGEQGIMQITPRWHPGVDYLNPAAAIDYGAKYLRQNFDRFGDWKLAVMAYNWGPTSVANWIKNGKPASTVPNVTRSYIQEVFGSGI